MDKKFIEIDGSKGEGGGAVLRLATALAVLLGQGVRVTKIRQNRPKPGLKTQHLTGLEALERISGGELIDAHLGSREITFWPKGIEGGTFDIRIKTAGSIGLILQLLSLASIRAKSPVTLQFFGGATFGLWAPTLNYLENVTFKYLKRMRYEITTQIMKHGFYPKGGAKVKSIFKPVKKLKGLCLEEQGKIETIEGVSIASRSLERNKVAVRQAKSALRVLRSNFNVECHINSKYIEASNPGSGLCLYMKSDTGVILGADKIGEKKIRAEDVGKACALDLIEACKSGATCDRFCSDQLIPYIALTQGPSRYLVNELTQHAKTNIWLMESLLKRKIYVDRVGHLYKIHVHEAYIK